MSLASTSITAFEQRLGASKAGAVALLLGCWAIVACSSFIATFGRLPDGLSNDDAMRLVGVRDFIAGQPWFDLVQHRLGTAGSLMHWSRLIDLPIALLLGFFQLFADTPTAERLTMAVWPLLVLLPVLAGLRALGRALHGDAAGTLALVLGMFLAPVVGHFRPGALDHHNVQIALLLWAAAWTIRFTPRDAVLAGLAMGVSLAIGLEMLPAIAVLAASAGARWVLSGERCKRECIAFGVAFAVTVTLLLLATVPPARWFAVACDALSVAHFSAGVVGGAGLALLALAWSHETFATRLTGAVALGVAVVAAVALVTPECLANPYAAVHPRLQEFWLANVAETQSVSWLLRTDPVEAVALFLPPAAGLALCSAVAIRARTDADGRWLIAAALQGVLLAVAMWELRGAAAANAVAAALLAASLLKLLPPLQGAPVVFGQRPVALAAVFALTPLLLAGAGHSVARAAHWAAGTQPSPLASARTQCHEVSSYAPLAALPAGRVLALIDSGAFILAQSGHSVLAAPYHRNNDGNLAAVEMLLASPADARGAMERNGIAYVVLCPGAPEFRLYQRSPDGLAVRLAQGHVLAFLQPVALGDSPLRAWRVTPSR
jgi:hypothetical protein